MPPVIKLQLYASIINALNTGNIMYSLLSSPKFERRQTTLPYLLETMNDCFSHHLIMRTANALYLISRSASEREIYHFREMGGDFKRFTTALLPAMN